MGNTPIPAASLDDVQVPASGDWSLDTSDILLPGAAGDWDERFPHGVCGPVLDVDGTWHFYYIGSGGDRSSDGGPAERAVGLTTASTLGGSWSKSASNPVIPWSTLQNNADEEEGAWRVAGLVDTDGTVCLYVCDLVGSGGNVNGDIRLFTSSDGVSFTDQGIVIAWDDASFIGDDELGPMGAWRDDGGTYHLFYTTGADSNIWEYVHASGPARDTFDFDETALDGANGNWGHATDPIEKSDTELVHFVGDNNGDFFAYTGPRSDPGNFGSAVQTYTGLSSDQFAVVLDRANSQWVGFFTTGTQGDSTGVDRYTAPMQVV